MNATSKRPSTATDDAARERANRLATETITLHDWSPLQYIDKNPSGIWHVIYREELGHPIPELRHRLDAVPEHQWDWKGEAPRAELTTRGSTWHGADADDVEDDEFTFVYVAKYELIDTMISTKTGKWSCTFRLLEAHA